eukprot:Gb_39263 [translate_table: standard]
MRFFSVLFWCVCVCSLSSCFFIVASGHWQIHGTPTVDVILSQFRSSSFLRVSKFAGSNAPPPSQKPILVHPLEKGYPIEEVRILLWKPGLAELSALFKMFSAFNASRSLFKSIEMRCTNSKKLVHHNDGDDTRVNIEETCPLNGVDVESQPKNMRVTKGASWTAFIIILVFLAGFITMLKDISDSQHSGLAEDRKLQYFHNWFVNAGSNLTISNHLGVLTRQSHVAGTPGDMFTAQYVLQQFQKYGLAAHTVDYEVLLSYPLARSLSLSMPTASLQHKFFLEEEKNTEKSIIPPFHAYAPSGTVMGQAVYVNYGREEDYRKLAEMGVNVSGAIVIARYGDIYRGTVVKIAAKAGAIAAILYGDPQQFGGNGTQGYFPDSKWLPPTGVQRGTVLQGIGDPLTPGWASTKHAEKLSLAKDKDVLEKFPSIPSLPISANEARHILMSLSGPTLPPSWRGSLEINDDYGVGRGPGILNFSYVENQTMATIRNVFAVIRGSEEPDRFVLLGNHRDAWTYGAVDPNSGTAALLEIARRFGALLRQGWRPRRSIVLCSWDAEEYGMIGSTEWVEQNFDNLGTKAVAYLNVDCAVQGPGFFAGATPQLDNLLIEVTKEVKDPDSNYETVHKSWVAASTGNKVKIDRLGGGGSDFAAFLQHAGVPSIDMFYGEDYPVYHTLYDSFNWMKEFGDPYFHRHVAVSAIWGLLALRLADDRVIPFDYHEYAEELQSYARNLQESISTSDGITMEPIWLAIKEFSDAANKAAQEAEALRKHRNGEAQLVLRRRAFNDRLLLTERAFLDSEGLKGRPWFKHLVYAPSEGNEYTFSSFPGVVDAIISASRSNGEENGELQHEIWRVARRISQAAAVLTGELT